ncbi:MAG: STAS domain-containing protein [SAR324 cluster bacterium]|nr:STAS domain-containing protein [SAR324 cluster bacterium]
MTIIYTIKESICEIKLEDALNHTEGEELIQLCQELIDKETFSKIRFNMQNCESLSSSGIGSLVSISKMGLEKNINLELYQCQDKVKKLLKITGVDGVISVS